MRYISLNESDIRRIVKRVISEDMETLDSPSDLPLCVDMMKSKRGPDYMGAGVELTLGNNVKLTYNGTVAPDSRGFQVHVNNKPFCFIPTKR